ncbi:hypothetical protein HA466_0218470 [Hirschfeldia incana]|nr:hypothetical protein HA466_0218470 [Hirschfeldia incana]KAJ0241454.1 hypothetical protein HA466_0218470 [Hirschfeldia incana]
MVIHVVLHLFALERLDEMMHQITLEINGVDKKTLYKAKVWVNSRLNFKELQEFKPVGDDVPITTPPILGADKA